MDVVVGDLSSSNLLLPSLPNLFNRNNMNSPQLLPTLNQSIASSPLPSPIATATTTTTTSAAAATTTTTNDDQNFTCLSRLQIEYETKSSQLKILMEREKEAKKVRHIYHHNLIIIIVIKLFSKSNG